MPTQSISFTTPQGLGGQVDPLSLLQGYQLDPTQFLARRLMTQGAEPIQGARTPTQAVGAGLNNFGSSILGAALARSGQQQLLEQQGQDAQALQQALTAAQAPDPTTGQPRSASDQMTALAQALQGNPRLAAYGTQTLMGNLAARAQAEQTAPHLPSQERVQQWASAWGVTPEQVLHSGVLEGPGGDPVFQQYNPVTRQAITAGETAAGRPVAVHGVGAFSTTMFGTPPGYVGPPLGGAPPAGPAPGQQSSAAPQPGAPNPTNPLNMRVPGQTAFQAFPTAVDGLSQAVHQLDLYQQRAGRPLTPLEIVSQWAPRGDGANDPAAYAQRIQQITGLDPNQPVDTQNPRQLAALMVGMSHVEGFPQPPEAVVQAIAARRGGIPGVQGASPDAGGPVTRAPAPPMAGAVPATGAPSPTGPMSDASNPPLAAGTQLAQAVLPPGQGQIGAPPAATQGPQPAAPRLPPQYGGGQIQRPGVIPGMPTAGQPSPMIPIQGPNGQVIGYGVRPAEQQAGANEIVGRVMTRHNQIAQEAEQAQQAAQMNRMITQIGEGQGGGPLQGTLAQMDALYRQMTGDNNGLQSWGINVNAPEADTMQKLSNMASMGVMRGVTNRLTNMELQFGSRTVANLSQTPPGRELLTRATEAAADWQQRRLEEAVSYLEQHGADLRYEGHMLAWERQNPAFSRDFIAEAHRIAGNPAAGQGAPAGQPAPGAPPPPQVPGAAAPQILRFDRNGNPVQ